MFFNCLYLPPIIGSIGVGGGRGGGHNNSPFVFGGGVGVYSFILILGGAHLVFGIFDFI